MTRRMVFLDRDGTVNVDHEYVYRIEDWKFTERAVDALKMLQTGGYGLAMVTNQSGIGRGYYSLADVQKLHEYLVEVLGQAGVTFDAIALCPHNPDVRCDCRKPGIGMAREIEQQLAQPINYQQSWTIGDKISDLEFGQALGTETALIRSEYWTASDIQKQPSLITDSLYDAACKIVR